MIGKVALACALVLAACTSNSLEYPKPGAQVGNGRTLVKHGVLPNDTVWDVVAYPKPNGDLCTELVIGRNRNSRCGPKNLLERDVFVASVDCNAQGAFLFGVAADRVSQVRITVEGRSYSITADRVPGVDGRYFGSVLGAAGKVGNAEALDANGAVLRKVLPAIGGSPPFEPRCRGA